MSFIQKSLQPAGRRINKGVYSTKHKKRGIFYPQMTQMDADERHEDLTGMDRIYRIRLLSHHEVLSAA